MSVEPVIRLGQRLRARRTELALTLSEVAYRAGLSVPYVANLEKGRGNPTLDVIVGLAEALRVSPGDLLGGDQPAEQLDELLVDLPVVLASYAKGKIFQDRIRRMATQTGRPADEMHRVLLEAMAAAPRPADRDLTEDDCRRLLDVYWLILTAPGDQRGPARAKSR